MEINWKKLGKVDYNLQLENTEQRLMICHDADNCWGTTCPIHKRTNHHMRTMPQHFRDDIGMIERICTHGVGHPDPDSTYPVDRPELSAWAENHGCCGCCIPPDTWKVPPSLPKVQVFGDTVQTGQDFLVESFNILAAMSDEELPSFVNDKFDEVTKAQWLQWMRAFHIAASMYRKNPLGTDAQRIMDNFLEKGDVIFYKHKM